MFELWEEIKKTLIHVRTKITILHSKVFCSNSEALTLLNPHQINSCLFNYYSTDCSVVYPISQSLSITCICYSVVLCLKKKKWSYWEMPVIARINVERRKLIIFFFITFRAFAYCYDLLNFAICWIYRRVRQSNSFVYIQLLKSINRSCARSFTLYYSIVA